jgi:hypothetical protein
VASVARHAPGTIDGYACPHPWGLGAVLPSVCAEGIRRPIDGSFDRSAPPLQDWIAADGTWYGFRLRTTESHRSHVRARTSSENQPNVLFYAF